MAPWNKRSKAYRGAEELEARSHDEIKVFDAEEFAAGYVAGLDPERHEGQRPRHRVNESSSYQYQMGQLGRYEMEQAREDPTPLYWCPDCRCNQPYAHFPH